VGGNAFAHSSGIHQDGFLKMRENYEIIRPEDVGFPSATIVLTARSGRAALNHHLERLGYKLDKEELADAYHRFLTLADNKLDITDDDLRGLVVQQEVK
jgi:2-isopropylmalate synthase